MPKPDIPPTAVVISGGKQYRVVPGDRILVDRLAAEPGASVKLGRMLLLADGDGVKVGQTLDGLDVEARVIAHRRGPRIESIRYKSKKRVRVHRGGRSYLTSLEIIAVGGVGVAVEEEEKEEPKAKPKGRAKAAPAKKKAAVVTAEVKPEAVEETKPVEDAPAKKPARRRTKKEAE
ncbi:MAG TPA: 50S ribosomal protein L21 [Candidatus Limnocylindrales bacterium]|nr:50S ribosomal protein L21 [Candidatus Limnocylindrales bacterium]